MFNGLSNLELDSSLKDSIDRLETLYFDYKAQKTEYKDILINILEKNGEAYGSNDTVLELINKVKQLTDVIVVGGGTDNYLLKDNSGIVIDSSGYTLARSIFVGAMRGYVRVKTNTRVWSGTSGTQYKFKFTSEAPDGTILDEYEFAGSTSNVLETSKDLKVVRDGKVNIYGDRYQTGNMKFNSIDISYNVL